MNALRNHYGPLLSRCRSIFSLGALLLVLAFVMVISQVLAGCSSVSGMVTSLMPSGSLPALQTFSLSADRLSNNGAPVAVDLVLVLDKKPLVMLGALRASDWFNNRQDLLRQYPNQLRVTSWEIVPGQVINPTTVLGDQGKLMGVLVFADYPGEQSFRADASSMRSVQVHLSKNDFSIASF